MKNKKILSMLISASMLAGTIPALGAYTTSNFDEVTRDYVYKNNYSENTVQVVNKGFNVAVATDPTDKTNQVMAVSDSNGLGDAQDSYNVMTLSPGTTGTTYASAGIDGSKKTYFTADIYLPNGLLEDLANGGCIKAGLPSYNGSWPYNLAMPIKIEKTQDKNTFTLTQNSITKEIAPDTWFNLKIEYQFGETNLTSYINNEQFVSAEVEWWMIGNALSVNNELTGMKFIYKGTETTNEETGAVTYNPLTNGFLIDNAAIYQWAAQDAQYSITEGQTGVMPTVPVTVKFGCDVSALDFTGLFTATDAAGNKKTLTSTVSSDTVSIDISSLDYNTAYTFEFAGMVDDAKEFCLAKKSIGITTHKKSELENDTAVYLYKDSFDDLTTNKGLQQAELMIVNDDVAKILGEDNNAMQITQRSDGVATITLSNRNMWDSTSYTYEQEYANTGATGQLVWTWDMYISDDMENMMGIKDYDNTIMVGPRVGYHMNQNPLTFMDYRLSRYDTNKSSYSNSPWQYKEIKYNQWNKITWVADTTAKTVRVYVNDKLHQSWDTLSGSQNGEFSLNRVNHGIQLVYHNDGKYTIPEKALYVDNAAVYRAMTPLTATYEFDEETRTGALKFTSPVKPEQAKYISITDADDKPVEATIEFDGDGLVATTTFADGTLLNNASYKVVIDSELQDKYMQYISNEDTVLVFSTGEGPRVDEKTYIYQNDYNSNITGANSYEVSIDKTADPKDSTNSAIILKKNSDVAAWGGYGVAEFSPNGSWGTSTYASYGMTDNKTLFAEADIYLPSTLLDEIDTYKYRIGLTTSGCGDQYQTATVSVAKSQDGTKFVLTSTNGTTEITADTWFKISYEYQPGSETGKVYIDGELLDTAASGNGSWQPITSESGARGLSVMIPKAAPVTAGIYVDNVKIWQMKNAIGIDEVYYDGTNEEIVVDLATSVKESEISKVTLMLNSVDVSSLITARSLEKNAHVVRLSLPLSELAVLTEYTITIPVGFTDRNNQVLAEAVSDVFTTPKSKSVYIVSSTTPTVDSTGARMSVTIDNSASEAAPAWVVMAVYGKYNELIAMDEASFDALDSEQTVDFEVTEDCSKAEEVRVFVWDDEETMVPHQKNELVWSSVSN